MECSVCRVRGAIGFCATCERMLCEVCGSTCSECHKVVCRNHRRVTRSGKTLCRACSAERQERKMMLQNIGNDPAPQESTESFSFESLQEELGDILGENNEEATQESVPEFLPGATAYEQPEAAPGKKSAQPEYRILKASAPQATPTWLKALGVALLALTLTLIFAGLGSDVALFQPWLSYCIIVLAVIAFGIGVQGIRDKKLTPIQRSLCWITLAATVVTILIALAIRAPDIRY